ncbi:MAG: hypothetical protein EXR10_12225 [Alphaproteobacteria bacterium]|nr:hypothetical protein [Alphaproteobacteria bacterium]
MIVRFAVLLSLLISSAVCGAEPSRHLRLAFDDRNFGFGNPYTTLVTAGVATNPMIFDALTILGTKGAIEPGLALAWEPLSPTQWQFRLRPGVTFSNGEPFDAAAVKATFDFLISPAAKSLYVAGEVRNIRAVRVVDHLTVVVETTVPDAILPKRLSLVYIVAPEAWAQMGPEAFAQTPSGTGSFVVTNWGRGTGRIVMNANRTSWRKPAQIDTVDLYVVPDQTSRLQALQSGQVDFSYNVGFDDIDALEAAGFVAEVKPVALISALALSNVRKDSLMRDVRVRQALNLAINKQAITDVIMHGTTQPDGQGAISTVFGFNPDVHPYPFDTAAAKSLISQAGYGNGLSLRAAIWGAGLPGSDAMYSQIAQDLKAAGITIVIDKVTSPEWLALWSSGEWGAYDLISTAWNSSNLNDPIRAIEAFACRRPGAFFCAPELEPLIDASNTDFNVATREVKLRELLARFHDLAPTIYLFGQSHIYARSKRLTNITFRHEQLAIDEIHFAAE